MDVIFEIYTKKWTRITEFHRCVKFTVAQCYCPCLNCREINRLDFFFRLFKSLLRTLGNAIPCSISRKLVFIASKLMADYCTDGTFVGDGAFRACDGGCTLRDSLLCRLT